MKAGPQRIGSSNCLAKTQVYAKPKGEVYGLTPAPVSYTHLEYVSDDPFVQRQKEDIQELTSMFRDMLDNSGTDNEQEYLCLLYTSRCV